MREMYTSAHTDMRFVYRSYTKPELARMYVPEKARRTAMRTFNDWIRHQPKLWKQLQRSGADIHTQVFTASQVRIITQYLGEP